MGQAKPSYVDHAKKFVLQLTLQTGEPYSFTLYDVTAIDLDNLQSEVAGQATRYAFHAMLHVSVREAIAVAEGELAAYVSDVNESVRAELQQGTKEPTETRVKQAIAARQPYRDLKDRIVKLEQTERRLAVVRESLTQRRDMLTSATMFRAPESGQSIADRARQRYSPRK